MAVHIVAGRRVITDFWAKPIPDRRFDWQAIEDGYEESGPIGSGPTEAEALANLAARFAEQDDEVDLEPPGADWITYERSIGID